MRLQLLGFLHDRNPQARQIALSNLLGHTQNDAPSRSIFFKGLQGSGLGKQPESEVVRDLKLLCRDQLVNLSQRSLVMPEPHTGDFYTGDRSRCLQSSGQLIGLTGYDFSSLRFQFSPVPRLLHSCWYMHRRFLGVIAGVPGLRPFPRIHKRR